MAVFFNPEQQGLRPIEVTHELRRIPDEQRDSSERWEVRLFDGYRKHLSADKYHKYLRDLTVNPHYHQQFQLLAPEEGADYRVLTTTQKEKQQSLE